MGLQRRQVEEAGPGGVGWDDEDVVVAGREAGAGAAGVAMGWWRRRRWRIHGEKLSAEGAESVVRTRLDQMVSSVGCYKRWYEGERR